MKNLSLILFILSFVSASYAETFSYDSSLQDWGSWGSGLGVHDARVGHSKPGSMWMSADWGDAQTLHYSWNKLSPGLYKVTAYVRAEDVQAHPDGSSFWHFYDGGKGTENVFVSLHGSYDWRKIQYTVKVDQKNLSIWFRLKSPGQVWIDDLTLEPASETMSPVIASGLPLNSSAEQKVAKPLPFKETVLLDFDGVKRSHPFNVVQNKLKQNMGKFSSRQYYNFDPSDYLSGNWSDYDRISLDVFNGNKQFVEVYLTLTDGLTTNYWSQLNHKTHLAPGWNKLNLSLKQFLGERGSHRFHRGVNLKDIRKWFIVVDPNEKFAQNSNYYIDNIKLSRNPYPVAESGIYPFDFTSHKDPTVTGFTKVTSQDLFTGNKNFGFVTPKFWRVEDSQWTNSTHRYSIGLLGGHFRAKMPNGTYKLQLIIDRLGYWDTPFWKDRTVYINGRPIFKEARSSGMDYLKDWLQFEAIVPETDDHPYDLYLKRLFKPIEHTFQVTNGLLDLEFEGDATGISLNSLIVWEKSKDKQAKEFLIELDKWARTEFDWIARSIIPDQLNTKSELVTLIEPSLTLVPAQVYPAVSREITFQGAAGERPYQLIQLRGNGLTSIELTDLVNAKGEKISAAKFQLAELIPQYISPDLNHETYMVAGKFFKPLPKNSLQLSATESRFIMLNLPVEEKFAKGTFKGSVIVKNGKVKNVVPVTFKSFQYELPKVDFPVGFFGPDPITYSYFASEDMNKIRKKYRHQAIALLGQAGFTTISGLPEAKVIMDGDLWRLDSSAPDEAMTAAVRSGMHKTFFSYGGKFPQQFFDGSLIPSGMNENEFYKKSSELLSIYLSQPGMPKIVHTFSDEAGGYSDKVSEDISFAKKVKTKFPFMLLGGFGSKADPKTSELNKFFDYGFFSNVTKAQTRNMDKNSKWGSYNASPGNLDDPRYTLGPGLYFAQQMGLSHYLEWHASSVNNYPYYDLDGRESDVTMFMPSSDGNLYPTLRYELAVEGLHAYRKLKLLNQLSKSSKSSAKSMAARSWLKAIEAGQYSSDENILKPISSFNFSKFHHELNHHLEQLLN